MFNRCGTNVLDRLGNVYLLFVRWCPFPFVSSTTYLVVEISAVIILSYLFIFVLFLLPIFVTELVFHILF